ncbi:hypothetical protein H8N00_29720 [Streptomyces sp. AC563]|uniref:hypothetical protein n=1 Tax=Streptomyces buecherae TaxID=2763006 RepID=UPI00164D7C8A|nr:hypothetical protein [Streptomyces buecherae]MBC3992977.1 hypothetical protein [Streptomyces buecherae]
MRSPSAPSSEPATPTATPTASPVAVSPAAVSPVAAPVVVVALAAALLGVAPAAASAAPAAGAPADRVAALAPECGDASDVDFPIGTTLHAGPGTYRAGDGWRHWRLDLRNTTRVACAAIHPVALFADQGHALRPGHLRVEFRDPYAPGGQRWRPVRFEATDQDENVGVFDGGSRRVVDGGSRREVPRFKGFTVPARETLTVRVRVRFAADAPTGPASAAVTAMQRQHQDGDWVGQSGTYRFTIEAPAAARPSEPGDADGATDGATDGSGGDADARSPGDADADASETGTGLGGGGTGAGNAPGGHREAGAGAETGAGAGSGDDAATPGDGPAGGGAGAEPGEPPADAPPRLAATGSGPPWWGLLALALGLVGAGVPLVARARAARR